MSAPPSIFYLAGVVQDLATGVYSVKRQLVPTISNGLAVPDPAPVTLQVQGCLQPASKVDLQRLTEGRRTTDMRALFTPVALFIQSDTNMSDLVTVGADVFEVSECQPFGDGEGSDYWRAVLLRVARLNVGQP